MIIIPDLSIGWMINLIIGIAAMSAWGVTETIKSLVRSWLIARSRQEPWWFSGSLRATAIVVGALTGSLLMWTTWSIGLGVAAGAGMSSIVQGLKNRFRASVKDSASPDLALPILPVVKASNGPKE